MMIIDGVDVSVKDKIDNIRCYALPYSARGGHEAQMYLWELEDRELDLDEWVVSAIDRELRDES